jgi:hypothetical protein
MKIRNLSKNGIQTLFNDFNISLIVNVAQSSLMFTILFPLSYLSILDINVFR